MGRIGYGRVSTRDQNPDSQHDALTAAGCEQIFIEKASGKLARRPEWDECLKFLRAGDELVITKLDRAGRSVRHLLDVAANLQTREVDLVVLQQGIDTTTPAGRLQFHDFAAMAEFVGDLICASGTNKGQGPQPYNHSYTYTNDGNLKTRVESGATTSPTLITLVAAAGFEPRKLVTNENRNRTWQREITTSCQWTADPSVQPNPTRRYRSCRHQARSPARRSFSSPELWGFQRRDHRG